jgi:A/G-specific adenine glycosylase
MKFFKVENFSKKLVQWQKKHGRHDLPWQKNRTAYRVWLSEIMLQQTQVASVIHRYDQFLKRFPTVQALASASVDEVLSEWSGMGYYTRARNLHRCAQVVVKEYQGVFPRDPKLLESLPGIGKSTAAAIAVFAYAVPAAILDGNVKRVLARIWGIQEDLAKPSQVKLLWAHAENLLPHNESDLVAYTQGLMDFGATACTPNQPACMSVPKKICPFESNCQAKKKNLVKTIPLKVRKVKVTQKDLTWWVLIYRRKVLLEKRCQQGIWEGLWCFPEELSFEPKNYQAPPPIRHVLTHQRLNIQPKQVILEKQSRPINQQQWFDLDGLDQLAMPKPMTDFLKNLTLTLDGE